MLSDLPVKRQRNTLNEQTSPHWLFLNLWQPRSLRNIYTPYLNREKVEARNPYHLFCSKQWNWQAYYKPLIHFWFFLFTVKGSAYFAPLLLCSVETIKSALCIAFHNRLQQRNHVSLESEVRGERCPALCYYRNVEKYIFISIVLNILHCLDGFLFLIKSFFVVCFLCGVSLSPAKDKTSGTNHLGSCVRRHGICGLRSAISLHYLKSQSLRCSAGEKTESNRAWR